MRELEAADVQPQLFYNQNCMSHVTKVLSSIIKDQKMGFICGGEWPRLWSASVELRLNVQTDGTLLTT